MALNERHFAELLVDWRQQASTGTGYIPITDAIDAAQLALDELQKARADMGRMAETFEAMSTAGADRAVSDGAK